MDFTANSTICQGAADDPCVLAEINFNPPSGEPDTAPAILTAVTALVPPIESQDLGLEDLMSALRAGPPLRLAIMFGSAARGAMHEASDVDIGIIPADPALSLAAELDLQVSLERVCGRPVDLVRLDRAPTLVKWQVARDAKVLLEGAPFEASRFIASAASEYLDFEPTFTEAAERFRKRLAARVERT
jgi:predicted nucleotidyltransferase